MIIYVKKFILYIYLPNIQLVLMLFVKLNYIVFPLHLVDEFFFFDKKMEQI